MTSYVLYALQVGHPEKQKTQPQLQDFKSRDVT